MRILDFGLVPEGAGQTNFFERTRCRINSAAENSVMRPVPEISADAMRSESGYQPHLMLNERVLQPGEEWPSRMRGWSLVQIRSGEGYLLESRGTQKLEPGMMLIFPAQASCCIRASQLGEMHLYFFRVEPERLAGLVSLEERTQFEAFAAASAFALKVLPADSPASLRLSSLWASRNGHGLSFRLQLLQIFVEVAGDGLRREPAELREQPDATERVRQLLHQSPASTLLDLSFAALAQEAGCTPRHLSRVFHELVGMSFREKQAEIRLTRATELLATTQSKVVDVALESGYQSLSLFNAMFKRRYGSSPGRWRLKQRTNKARPSVRIK